MPDKNCRMNASRSAPLMVCRSERAATSALFGRGNWFNIHTASKNSGRKCRPVIAGIQLSLTFPSSEPMESPISGA